MRCPCPLPGFLAPATEGAAGVAAGPRDKAPFLEPQTGSPRRPGLLPRRGARTEEATRGSTGCSPVQRDGQHRFLRPRHLVAPVKLVLPHGRAPPNEPALPWLSAFPARGGAERCVAGADSPAARRRAPVRGAGTGSAGRRRSAPPGYPRASYANRPGLPAGLPPRDPIAGPVPAGPSVPRNGKTPRPRYCPKEHSEPGTEGRAGPPGPAAFVAVSPGTATSASRRGGSGPVGRLSRGEPDAGEPRGQEQNPARCRVPRCRRTLTFLDHGLIEQVHPAVVHGLKAPK